MAEKNRNIAKITVIMFAFIMLFSGCGKTGSIKDEKLSIVATIFPEYDWVMNVLGDKAQAAEVTMLLDSGVDLHSYQPSADDIIKISSCDLFIYVGGESDEWVEDALKQALNKDVLIIDMLDVLGDAVKEEEITEGMEEEKGGEETEYDEHVWLSLKNAKIIVGAISDALIKLDGENSEVYKENAREYIKKLDALDEKFVESAKNAKLNTLLFADRFPFRYLVDDYGIEYYAAFAGCSAESEASFETVTFLIEKMNELGLPAILTIEGSDGKMAETIASSCDDGNVKILVMDSMQSETLNDAEEGKTYLSVMEKNLEVMAEALGF